MRIVRAADTMLLVELEPRIDREVNRQAIHLANTLRGRQLRGVRDVVPAYCTVGVHFDPLATDLAALERAIELDHAVGPVPADADRDATMPADQVIEIPVSYGDEHGPDLDTVAAWAGCPPDEVIARHVGRIYRIYMLGFVGGFAYLGDVDPSIAAPRRATPRERVPAGSVGIAGVQTGVYPLITPGGWQIIGRTEVLMFDVSRTPPNRLAPGDAVRFVNAAQSA